MLLDWRADTAILLFSGLLIIAVALMVLPIVTFKQKRMPTPLFFIECFGAYAVVIMFFAIIYHIISDLNHAAFNCRVTDYTDLYFSITTMATVGFGDIYPVSRAARAAVSAEVVLGAFFNIVIFALLASRLTSSDG